MRWGGVGGIVGGVARNLTIRVLGECSNAQYARLAYEVHLSLRAAGLGHRAFFFLDNEIKASDLFALFGEPLPLRSRWLCD